MSPAFLPWSTRAVIPSLTDRLKIFFTLTKSRLMTDPQRSQFLGKEQQKIAVFSHNSKIVNSSKIDTLFLDPKSYTFQLGYLLPFKKTKPYKDNLKTLVGAKHTLNFTNNSFSHSSQTITFSHNSKTNTFSTLYK